MQRQLLSQCTSFGIHIPHMIALTNSFSHQAYTFVDKRIYALDMVTKKEERKN